jgi:hypothetical protein
MKKPKQKLKKKIKKTDTFLMDLSDSDDSQIRSSSKSKNEIRESFINSDNSDFDDQDYDDKNSNLNKYKTVPSSVILSGSSGSGKSGSGYLGLSGPKSSTSSAVKDKSNRNLNIDSDDSDIELEKEREKDCDQINRIQSNIHSSSGSSGSEKSGSRTLGLSGPSGSSLSGQAIMPIRRGREEINKDDVDNILVIDSSDDEKEISSQKINFGSNKTNDDHGVKNDYIDTYTLYGNSNQLDICLYFIS